MLADARAEVDLVAEALTGPCLVVIAGLPGAGKTALARAALESVPAPVLSGGGLATLRDRAGITLAGAIRAPVPTSDPALAVEAVRARLGDGVLLLDDLQWADWFTVSLLPRLARYARIVAIVRTPAPLLGGELTTLRAAATVWVEPPALGPATLAGLARSAQPGLDDAAAALLAARSGGNPGVLVALAGAPAEARAPGAALPGVDGIAALVAELPQAERTALAAIGLLGRAAGPELLGEAATALLDLGLLERHGSRLRPRHRIVAEVAAGVLPPEQRATLHRSLAELVAGDGEAARHLAAAGDSGAAADRALHAAAGTDSIDTRAAYLLLACEQRPDDATRRLAADAAGRAGRTSDAYLLLEELEAPRADDRVRGATLQALALLDSGEHLAAERALIAVTGDLPAVPADVPAGVPEDVVGNVAADVAAAHRGVLIRAVASRDPARARAIAEHGGRPSTPAVLAAYAGALRVSGDPRWDEPLRNALASTNEAASWPIAAELVTGLRGRLRTAAAATAADHWATRARDAAAYGWEMTFRAEALWAHLHTDAGTDETIAAAALLGRHEIPAVARPLVAATRALATGDRGELAAATAAIRDERTNRLVRWVSAELAWLDGDNGTALALAGGVLADLPADDPAGPLAALTTAWAGAAAARPPALPPIVTATVDAIESGDWSAAADHWQAVMRREQVRCLLATAAVRPGSDAVAQLRAAEMLADTGGLTLLAGRARRDLRRHGVPGATPARAPGPADVHGLSRREREVIDLVAEGHPSRRIAERLGLTAHTVESYVKSAMLKLGARTRTEATILARRTR